MNEKLKPNDVDIVIYHYPCQDGYGSRWVAERFFNQIGKNDIRFYGIQCGSPPPNNLEGKNVLICDISFKESVFNELLTIVNNILIIDHHKSAEKDLKDIDDIYKIFDMNHSGAYLTWKYFFPNEKIPKLIEYIQDRDIWTKKLKNTDAFFAWFQTIPMDYEEYNKYYNDDLLMEKINIDGMAMIKLNEEYIKFGTNASVCKFIKIGSKYYFINHLNTRLLKSDIGNQTLLSNPLSDFSAMYSINGNWTLFSLRSTNKHVDVSEIATSFGGGGHRNASGIVVKCVTNHLPGDVIEENGRLYNNLQNIYFESICINNNLEIKVVYLNSSVYKKTLGSYLLQTKYDDVQECIAIQNYRKNNYDNDNDNEVYEKCLISAIWNYDGCNDITYFSIVPDDSIKNNNILIENICKP